MKDKPDLDYLIVLGAQVNGTVLTRALKGRTDRALSYLKENPSTKAVLSGGQGKGEEISEAQAMCRYLTSQGIDRERLLLEDRSTSTRENLIFSFQVIGTTDVSVGVVTDFYHVLRGVLIGRKCGCKRICPVPSPYRSWRLLIYIPREFLALLKDKILGYW